MATKAKRKAKAARATWTSTVHVTACHKNTSGREYTRKEDEEGNNLDLLERLYVNSIGQLVGVSNCGSKVCAAETPAEMQKLAEFIANCCGMTLTAKPKA